MQIRQIKENEPIPYDLLLLADPFIEMVNNYFNREYCFVMPNNEQIIGIYILSPLNLNDIEIKNIAVEQGFQRKGIGSSLLKHAEITAKHKGYSRLIIGTADASHIPLKLYRQMGFKEYDVKKDFFINNYPEPVYEKGEQCINMIMLEKILI